MRGSGGAQAATPVFHAAWSNIGYWGLGMKAEHQLELVREAEDTGFDSVWVAEACSSDAATVLGWLAAQTSRIKIGSAIFQMPARSPAMTAMTAATLDRLSGGACCSASARRAAGGRGLARAALRQPAPARASTWRSCARRSHEARVRRRAVHAPPAGRARQGAQAHVAPVQERIPIYIAAIGPKNTQLTGEIADGWLPIFFSPEHVDESRRVLEEGAARSGARSTARSTSRPG